MPIQSGTHLDPYAIVCVIGAGGMGEVYRTRDPYGLTLRGGLRALVGKRGDSPEVEASQGGVREAAVASLGLRMWMQISTVISVSSRAAA